MLILMSSKALSVYAFIPARGGSKGIPKKNLAKVGTSSLVSRAVASCLQVDQVSKVFISSDDNEILKEGERAGATMVSRPATLATDTSRSEDAILHWLESLTVRPDVVAFVECTSPFISPCDLSKAIDLVRADEFDCVFSASPTDVLLWEKKMDSSYAPVGHNPFQQTMRQERPQQFAESGAFFVFRTNGFIDSRCRFFGRIGAVTVSPLTSIEIDEPWQLQLANLIETSGLNEVQRLDD